jgi:hypothetical protein
VTFEGEFCPPSVGATSVPFPIAGKGSCTFTADALQVQGFAPARGASLFALLGGLAAAGGALAVKFLFMPGMGVETIGGVFAAGLVAGAVAPRAARKDKPVSHAIPWDRITKVKADPQNKGAAILTVKRHKPKGPIHFRPTDLDAFLSEAANRAGVLAK